MDASRLSRTTESAVTVYTDDVVLEGNLALPENARGIVLFAHGSGSSRHSPRNRYVAEILHDGALGTLLLDLLTPDEEQIDLRTRHLRFDIDLLADRLSGAAQWLAVDRRTAGLEVGLFGASTGAAAALRAAAAHPELIRAVVSRGGRPDLAGDALARVKAPTLLIVGGYDDPVLDLNREALEQIHAEKKLEIVPRATHLFEEPGALGEVARLSRHWFERYLGYTGPQSQQERKEHQPNGRRKSPKSENRTRQAATIGCRRTPRGAGRLFQPVLADAAPLRGDGSRLRHQPGSTRVGPQFVPGGNRNLESGRGNH